MGENSAETFRDLSALKATFARECLLSPSDENALIQVFESEIGFLRDKRKHPFNRGGEMDFSEKEIRESLRKASFAIGSAMRFQPVVGENVWAPGAAVALRFPKEADWLFDYFLDDAWIWLGSACERLASLMAIFWPVRHGEKIYFSSFIDAHVKRLKTADDSDLAPLLKFRRGMYEREIRNERNGLIHRESGHARGMRDWLAALTDRNETLRVNARRRTGPRRAAKTYRELHACIPPLLRYIGKSFR